FPSTKPGEAPRNGRRLGGRRVPRGVDGRCRSVSPLRRLNVLIVVAVPIPSGRFGHMEFVKVLALRGPNMWANFPVLEAWVDLGALKDSPSTSIPGFNDRLMAWLPTMIEHRCSEGVRGGFFQRLREGTWPGHILEHVALALQALV